MQSHFLDPLYPLTHLPNKAGTSHAQLVEYFLQGGSRFFQVRAKSLSDLALHRELLLVSAVCARYGARFVVNDRADQALASSASGVHLGQADLPVAAARRLLGPEAIIGLSTHTEDQFLQALEEDVDYVAIGPIFETPTKPGQNRPLGCSTLSRLSRKTQLPVVAIGGITLANVERIWGAGAASAAVISDIVGCDDPAGRVREYLELAARVKGK